MKNKCKVCGYEWIPRVEESKQCPNCKRYDWREKEETKTEEVKGENQ